MFACGDGDGTLLAGVAAWPEEAEVVVEVVAAEAPLLVIVEDSAQQ